MAAWSKDELQKIAERMTCTSRRSGTTARHMAPRLGSGRWRQWRALRAWIQRPELALVSSGGTTEGGKDQSRRMTKEVTFEGGRRPVERSKSMMRTA